MEFDVIDPKDFSFDEWLLKIEDFLEVYCKARKTRYERQEGEIYFAQDDIADIWGEESVLYRVPGEQGGLIEVRDGDEQLYLFIDEFAGRNLKDSKEGHSFQITRPRVVYGFPSHNEDPQIVMSPFHGASAQGVYFLHQGEREEYALPTSFDELKATSGGLREIIQWVHNQVNRIQDYKNITGVERPINLLTIKARFSHVSLAGGLIEALRSRLAVKERDDQGYVHIELLNPNSDYLRDVFAKLPSEAEFIKSFSLSMSWGVELQESEERVEVAYLGAEQRALSPLIHMPRRRTSQALREAMKAHFKGHRLAKHNYSAP
jgi:hypothetical protein